MPEREAPLTAAENAEMCSYPQGCDQPRMAGRLVCERHAARYDEAHTSAATCECFGSPHRRGEAGCVDWAYICTPRGCNPPKEAEMTVDLSDADAGCSLGDAQAELELTDD